MAEIVSQEAAIVAAGNKITNDVALGRIKVVTISTPASAAYAQDDTIASPVALPVGSRIIGFKVFHGAFGAGTQLNIGLRQTDAAKTVISANAIATVLDIAAVGNKSEASGAGGYLTVANNTITRTPEVSNIYATFANADPTDDAQLRIDVMVALPG